MTRIDTNNGLNDGFAYFEACRLQRVVRIVEVAPDRAMHRKMCIGIVVAVPDQQVPIGGAFVPSLLKTDATEKRLELGWRPSERTRRIDVVLALLILETARRQETRTHADAMSGSRAKDQFRAIHDAKLGKLVGHRSPQFDLRNGWSSVPPQ